MSYDVFYLVKALKAIGFLKGDRLAVMIRDDEKWQSCKIACHMLEGKAVGLPLSLTVSQVGTILRQFKANCAVLESYEMLTSIPPTLFDQLKFIILVNNQRPAAESVSLLDLLFSPTISETKSLLTWDEIMDFAKKRLGMPQAPSVKTSK